MSIPYAQLVIRWKEIDIIKGGNAGLVNCIVKSEIGYYRPEGGKWHYVQEGPTVTLDAQAFLVTMSRPLDQYAQPTIGQVLDKFAYAILDGTALPPTYLSVQVTDDQGSPMQALGTLKVPGRPDAPLALPVQGFAVTPAAQAELEVSASGYRPKRLPLLLVGEVSLSVQLERA